ncbi:bifunctional DNA primase/polymerase [Streptomyces sp. NPDC051214]|uniref:bifunctional DNA primase/polymerase n=1 Tax=Streptomyces sp. NPDC051214 TaxID=3155282 RepID=UPI003417FFDE
MHQIPSAPLPHAALCAAERGWHVFPLIPGAKRPAVKAWEQRATTDAERIDRCWLTADYNLGIATGPAGLVVIDLDVPKHDQDVPPAGTRKGVVDGADVLALLAEQQGHPWPDSTYTVRTPSGGTHLYFSAPEGAKLRNTAGALGWKVDTRAAGGYVVGAGSTVNGRPYTVVRETEPVPLPAWLTKLLTPAPLPSQRPVTVPLVANGRRGAYLAAAVNAEMARVSEAHEGNRNNALYQASVALGQLVAGRELGATYVHERLAEVARRAHLDEGAARRTIASGLRAGARKPRSFGRGNAA